MGYIALYLFAPRGMTSCKRDPSCGGCLQDQALEVQEALWRQHCAATQIAAVWRGRQSRRQLEALLAERKRARHSSAASAIQVRCQQALYIHAKLSFAAWAVIVVRSLEGASSF